MGIYYFLAIAAGFLQTLTAYGSLALPVVIIFATKKYSQAAIFTLAFVAGIVTDLLTGRVLGRSVIYFLLTAGLVLLIRSRFTVNWRWVVLLILCLELLSFVS